MGDQAGLATQLAALLQRPEVLTALGAALAPSWPTAPSTGRSLTWSRRGCLRTGRVCGWARPTPASRTGAGSGPPAAPAKRLPACGPQGPDAAVVDVDEEDEDIL